MLDPAGRVVMVSGATRGIGRAVVERLIGGGYAISAGARDVRALKPGARVMVSRYEAEDAASAKSWVAATMERFGRIDGLVCAAGINPMAKMLDEDESAFDAQWRVNVKAPMRLVRLAWPHLAAGGEGRVVTVASLSGKRVANDNLGYAMSKFAVVALTQAIRREGWDQGIRATVLCPGFVATDMTRHVTSFPRERMSRPEDMAALVETVMRLPNTATVGELKVNCRFEALV
jgi:NAD(P)-dependent dehydrogenase (short-subunit alcohol dehydrogenase family)